MQDNLAIELTKYCDKACLHCGSDAKFTRKADTESMTVETATEIIKQVAEINASKHMKRIRTVHLTGGEPVIWRDKRHRIGFLIKAIQEAGIEPQILTSSTHLTDKGYKRYMQGVESMQGLQPFDVFHSFNLYMVGVPINTRLKHTIPLFDEVFGPDRALGFFGVYDRSNRGATLDTFEALRTNLGFRRLKNRGTRNHRKVSKEGEAITLYYTNGEKIADVEFSSVDGSGGRSRKAGLKPVRAVRECYILDENGEGMQPVIGNNGEVYPCWAGPFPSSRPIGNIHTTPLATILKREPAYLEAFRACVEADHNPRTDICRFCSDVSKECLGYQFRK